MQSKHLWNLSNKFLIIFLLICSLFLVTSCEKEDDIKIEEPQFSETAEIFAKSFMWSSTKINKMAAYFYDGKYFYEVNETYKNYDPCISIYIICGILIDSFGITDESIPYHQSGYSGYLIAKEKGIEYIYTEEEITEMSKPYIK